jgi:hypothetical protein
VLLVVKQYGEADRAYGCAAAVEIKRSLDDQVRGIEMHQVSLELLFMRLVVPGRAASGD